MLTASMNLAGHSYRLEITRVPALIPGEHHMLHRKSTRNNDHSLKELYKKTRNRVTCLLRESKASYFYTFFQKIRNNMKQLWSGIKTAIPIKHSSNTNVISKLKDSSGTITTDPKVMANVFNTFFIKCFS